MSEMNRRAEKREEKEARYTNSDRSIEETRLVIGSRRKEKEGMDGRSREDYHSLVMWLRVTTRERLDRKMEEREGSRGEKNLLSSFLIENSM